MCVALVRPRVTVAQMRTILENMCMQRLAFPGAELAPPKDNANARACFPLSLVGEIEI